VDIIVLMQVDIVMDTTMISTCITMMVMMVV